MRTYQFNFILGTLMLILAAQDIPSVCQLTWALLGSILLVMGVDKVLN